jgi:hypothetical protein
MPSKVVPVLVGLLALTTCQPSLEPYQTDRFDLSAAPAAAEGYPMEVVEGRFTTSDGKSFPVSGGFLEGDWGLSHVGYVSGDGTAPRPRQPGSALVLLRRGQVLRGPLSSAPATHPRPAQARLLEHRREKARNVS